MAIIGSSPLGLVGLQSNDPNGVYSNYNNRSRNSGKGMISLFSGNRIIRPFSRYNIGGDKPEKSEIFDNSSTIHSNDVYNTTIPNIVDKLKDTKAALKLTDFAYLKDVGVFPNNRLMIARRFATPQLDNIMYNKGSERGSLVTLISWKPQGEDFLSISFGEKWEEAEATFKSILSEVGKDFKLPGDLGETLSGGSNIIPLPGSTELLQRKFFASIGLLDPSQVDQIPEGNPNLIKEAKQRKLVKAGSPGSGLNCKVDIKMKCVWEQKYIQGVDPTLAWMDIVSMVGRFGTSISQNYGLSGNVVKKVSEYLENPSQLITDTINGIKKAIDDIIKKVKDAINNIKNQPKEVPDKKTITENTTGLLNQFGEILSGLVNDIISTITKKYRERILGVLSSLSGMPSTPWHITLGNPLRPVFCSGDMLIGDVNLTFGPNLSFNDLPTTITAEFTLTNARPWGLQEILAKFNTGYIRVLSHANDDKGKLDKQDISDFSLTDDKNIKIIDGIDFNQVKKDVTTNLNIPNDQINITTPNIEYSTDNDVEINSDPNSEQPVVEPDSPPVTGSFTPNIGSYAGQKLTYKVKSFGPRRYVEVYDESNNLIYEGQPLLSSPSSNEVLIEAAKLSLTGS